MLRKVRAALIVTAFWLLCWVPFAVGLDHVLADILVPEPRIDDPYTPVRLWAIWGALSGLAFAVVLALGERGRAAGNLSTLRVLSWGATGAALVPLFYQLILAVRGSAPPPSLSLYWEIVLIEIGESALLGLASALGVLAILRASNPR